MELKEDDLQPGERYKLIKVIGRGAYGIVGAFEDTKTGKKVAIKRTAPLEDSIDARKMIREIRILHNFRHENIIELKRVIFKPHVGKGFGEFYLVTNLMDADLHKLIRKNRHELTDDHIKYIVYQIFRAMKFLHSRDIIHRDIKPSNILADEDCNIQICDFGFAREQNWEQNAMTEYVVTKHYRAPEIMLNAQNYQKAVDIWSVGCTVYELVTGKTLFNAKNYLELIKMFVSVLGSPDDSSLAFIKEANAKSFIKSLPATPQRKPTQGVEYSNPALLDLINKCLEFSPDKRITAEGALAHPYLKDFHDPSTEPSFDQSIDFAFESSDIDYEALKKVLIHDFNAVNKKTGEEVYDVVQALKPVHK